MQRWRRRCAQGHVIVVRYADAMVVGFQYLADAHRFLAELKQRLEAFALELHPDKTRIIEFGRFALENRRARGQGKPETFAFLGFTHIFGRTRQGRRLIRRHTIRERLNAKLRQVKATLRRMMHLPIPEQGRYLRLVLNGFYNYYAVPTNFRALNAFYYHVLSPLAALPPAAQPAAQADVAEDDADRGALAAQPEAAAPLSRLAVRRHDPRWEPGALAAHAGICAGGGEQSPSLPRRCVFNDLRTT